MRAAVLSAHGLDGLAAVDRAEPRPGPGEVLVRVDTVGVNQLDLNVIAGVGPGVAAKLPRVLGIDPAGEIVAAGDDVDAARIGEAVVVKPNIACGECPACARGREADCPAQTVVGVHREGGAAELVAVPARNAFARGGLSADVATAAVHSVPIVLNAIETAGVVAGERVLVTGAGGTLGRAATALAAHFGAEVVAASRGGLVDAPTGVRTVQAADPTELRAALTEIEADDATRHAGFDVVIDVSGHGPTLAAGIAALGWGGRAVFCAASVDPRVELDARDFYLRRKRLIGVASADYAQVRRALDLVAAGVAVPVVGSRHPLADVRDAYRGFADSPPGKVIIDVS
ncbi:alcohol dehydrogenase catalytic domain-containing protein [Agromyces endophyticus]|uniref:alcohol dehydrogenase catalytic domain-containing protein n=1 Tax=Agromyces sp. H17E-10 TaxID=2932244 RepID=UPI001FD41E07|nr:alcohol dehydrogenase catalytic domain-containing protein [Agromyces sp. H17E-10]UOQ87712.1 alcohol dehydrogenase catalytic domain-containing protein [Agromyces sp. H17E-10]